MHPATARGFGNHLFDDLLKHMRQRLLKDISDFSDRVQFMECGTKESVCAAIVTTALDIAAASATIAAMPHKSYIQQAHEAYNRHLEMEQKSS